MEEYGAVTREALQSYLPSREPRRYLYDLVADYPNRGGKMLRPSLCIATARAFGGRLEDALEVAVSLELLHNALLVHDDIEDDSEERRGRPTMHVMHGVPMAINVGDALTLMSLRPLLETRQTLGSKMCLKIFQEMDLVARESAEGQALELGWRQENVLDLPDSAYLLMVLKKTSWLTIIYPSRVGALIGTRGSIDPDRFVRFGFFLGAAFQIQDDLLNLVADSSYGKELDGDIWEGKRTLMLTRLYRESDEDDRERIRAALDGPREERSREEVQWIRDQMDRYDCIEYARQVAHGLAGAALEEYEAVYRGLPESRDKQFIEGLVTWVFERN